MDTSIYGGIGAIIILLLNFQHILKYHNNQNTDGNNSANKSKNNANVSNPIGPLFHQK